MYTGNFKYGMLPQIDPKHSLVREKAMEVLTAAGWDLEMALDLQVLPYPKLNSPPIPLFFLLLSSTHPLRPVTRFSRPMTRCPRPVTRCPRPVTLCPRPVTR